MFSKLLASLILRAAVIMWERKNNQQQEMAVRETIKNIKNNANALVERVVLAANGVYSKNVLKRKYIKAKIKYLKKQLENSNKNWVATYNIVSSKTIKKQNKKIKKHENGGNAMKVKCLGSMGFDTWKLTTGKVYEVNMVVNGGINYLIQADDGCVRSYRNIFFAVVKK